LVVHPSVGELALGGRDHRVELGGVEPAGAISAATMIWPRVVTTWAL